MKWIKNLGLESESTFGYTHSLQRVTNPLSRSSGWEVFCKKGVLKDFTKSQENTYVGVSF